MLSLADATAFVVNFIKVEGNLYKLGKIKLFKILYLADWERFKRTNQTMFDVVWYRIQMGPALRPPIWENLTATIADRYNINGKWEQPGSYTQFVFSSDKKFKVAVSSIDGKYLRKAVRQVIDSTAEAAAKLTYETEPMRWIVAQEIADGAGVQFRDFRINDKERIKFSKLAKLYKNGRINVGEITKSMGKSWTAQNAVLFLDQMIASRPLSKLSLSKEKRKKVLNTLLKVTTAGETQSSSKWVESSVVSSQRIEGIYVPLDAFVENDASV